MNRQQAFGIGLHSRPSPGYVEIIVIADLEMKNFIQISTLYYLPTLPYTGRGTLSNCVRNLWKQQNRPKSFPAVAPFKEYLMSWLKARRTKLLEELLVVVQPSFLPPNCRPELLMTQRRSKSLQISMTIKITTFLDCVEAVYLESKTFALA